MTRELFLATVIISPTKNKNTLKKKCKSFRAHNMTDPHELTLTYSLLIY